MDLIKQAKHMNKEYFKRTIFKSFLNMNQFKLFNKTQYDTLYLGHNALNIRSSKKEWERTLMDIYDIFNAKVTEC